MEKRAILFFHTLRTNKWMKYILTILIIGVGVFWFLNYDLYRMAKVQTKGYVNELLRSPSSAEYPLFITADSAGPDMFLVESYVDSQNGFGAMVRSDFRIVLHYTGGDKKEQNNWDVVDFRFDGENVTERFESVEEMMIRWDVEDCMLNTLNTYDECVEIANTSN